MHRVLLSSVLAALSFGVLATSVHAQSGLPNVVLIITGAVVPTDLEGIDLLPILAGSESEVDRTLFWRTAVGGQNQRAVRSGGARTRFGR